MTWKNFFFNLYVILRCIFMIFGLFFFKLHIFTKIFYYVEEKIILKYLKDSKYKNVCKYYIDVAYYLFVHAYTFNYFFLFIPSHIFLYVAVVALYTYNNYDLHIIASNMLFIAISLYVLVRLYRWNFFLFLTIIFFIGKILLYVMIHII